MVILNTKGSASDRRPRRGTRHGDANSKRRGSALERSAYPLWFYLPAGILCVVFFLLPTFSSFYFSLTRWSLFDIEFIGFANFAQFFREPQLVQGFINSFVYGGFTSSAKVILALLLALLLTSKIIGRGYLRSVVFFPVLVSTIGVGITFKALLDPNDGIIDGALSVVGIEAPAWLTNPSTALLTVASVDVWMGVGIATLIFIAGLVGIPQEYYEAARIDGAGEWRVFRSITLPLLRPAMTTVIILSLIGGLRSFDLIWAMTKGGPGFSSDVIASVIYKQYQAGFYGLSTAGNVVLFVVVAAIILPLFFFLNRKGIQQ